MEISPQKKTLDPQMRLDQDALVKLRRRFAREVKVQASLPAEIVIPIFFHKLGDENPWYLMPLAERSYWAQLQDDKKSGNFNLTPIADMLNALEILHNLGYVHRDLKPDNLLLHEGKWKLSDFGLVLPPEDKASRFTSTSSAWGTEHYMAPEQALFFGQVTSAADIFSIGCILHDAVSDKPRLPYSQLTATGPLGGIIERATNLDPTRRFLNIRNLREAITTALTEIPPSTDAMLAKWLTDIEELVTWNPEKTESFGRFIRGHSTESESLNDLFTVFDETKLEVLHSLDENTWDVVAEQYCKWTRQGFDFSYCDVLASRLEKIFEIGTPSQKALALLSIAWLGSSHNRWFVMGKLTNLCGQGLEDSIARRVAIEIRAEGLESDFIACAGVEENALDIYHPIIKQVLTNFVSEQASKTPN